MKSLNISDLMLFLLLCHRELSVQPFRKLSTAQQAVLQIAAEGVAEMATVEEAVEEEVGIYLVLPWGTSEVMGRVVTLTDQGAEALTGLRGTTQAAVTTILVAATTLHHLVAARAQAPGIEVAVVIGGEENHHASGEDLI